MFLYNRVNDRDAYEKDMLSRNIYLGPALRHLVINGVFEIKWKPDGDKIFDALVWNQGINSDKPALSPLYEPRPDYDCSGSVWYCPDIKTAAERIGNWQLLWRVPPKQRAPPMYDIGEVVDDIDQQFQTGKRGNMAPGLRKMDIVRLVAAFQVLDLLKTLSSTQPMAALPSPPKLGFFSLPTELRQIIYDYLIPTNPIPIDKYIIYHSNYP
ncbi:MAG: hypothetical protein Q9169_008211 [Polycauliona sp. 2 TL-2023]